MTENDGNDLNYSGSKGTQHSIKENPMNDFSRNQKWKPCKEMSMCYTLPPPAPTPTFIPVELNRDTWTESWNVS